MKAIAWGSGARCRLHTFGLKDEFIHFRRYDRLVVGPYALSASPLRSADPANQMNERQRREQALGRGRSWPEHHPGPDDGIWPSIRRRHLAYSTPNQNHYQVTADFGAFNKEYFVHEGKTAPGSWWTAGAASSSSGSTVC